MRRFPRRLFRRRRRRRRQSWEEAVEAGGSPRSGRRLEVTYWAELARRAPSVSTLLWGSSSNFLLPVSVCRQRTEFPRGSIIPISLQGEAGGAQVNLPAEPQLTGRRCFQPSLLTISFICGFGFFFLFFLNIFCKIGFKSYQISSSQGLNKTTCKVPTILTHWGCTGFSTF